MARIRHLGLAGRARPPNLIPIDFGVRLRSPRLLWPAAGQRLLDWAGRFARRAMR